MEFVIIANAFLSWVPMLMQNPTFSRIAAMINWLAEPLVKPAKWLLKKTPMYGMPIDISPIIAILLLGVVQNVLTMIIAVL